MLSKNGKWCYDLKIAYGVKDWKENYILKLQVLQDVYYLWNKMENIYLCVSYL